MENPKHLDGKSLSPGPFTFTQDRIESILRDDYFVRDYSSPHGGVPSPFLCDVFEYSFEVGRLRCYTKSEHNIMMEKFCTHLYDLTEDEESHVSRLDDALSTIVACNFQPKIEIPIIVDRTVDFLIRLPARSLELSDLPSSLNPAYLIPSSCGDEDSIPIQWENLRVAAHLSCNVIRSAILTTMAHDPGMLNNLIDSIAELLEVASRLSSSVLAETEKKRWFIVRAFLWTSWQRCTMIFFSKIVNGFINLGFNENDNSLFLRGTVPSPRLSIQEMSKRYASSKKCTYMCGWAFELLRNDPVCIGMDFRRFHQRYTENFRDHSSRCIADHPEASCKGDQPDSCQRFKGMFIENQSAHDYECRGDCDRLTWNEGSYRSISGARAVSIDDSSSLEKKINYCEASEKTLAISHVWSHGQGGRPEEPYGFNQCLHRRYTAIASDIGCTSYWMDTPCIPEDHRLRTEAISKINEVFFRSKATLVCDRDLMEIDVTDLSIDVRERLVATVIVSDWNLRSWTLLEAFRGRDAIYILCKDNAIVSLKETAEIVNRNGSIDLGLLLLTVPHLLPSRTKRDHRHINLLHPPFMNGYLTVEASGILLSHREASRSGDDMVIWSLLLHEQVFENAESFWRSREGNSVSTGYLLSSAPRLGVRGLGWAPSSPSAHLLVEPSSKATSRLLSHDGRGTLVGTITRDGFVAQWLVYDFIGSGLTSKAISAISRIKMGSKKLCRNNIRRIREKYTMGYRWGCLLRPIKSQTTRVPALNTVDSSKILVIVCATNERIAYTKRERDNDIPWEWKGIYDWDLSEPLPEFIAIKDVLIV